MLTELEAVHVVFHVNLLFTRRRRRSERPCLYPDGEEGEVAGVSYTRGVFRPRRCRMRVPQIPQSLLSVTLQLLVPGPHKGDRRELQRNVTYSSAETARSLFLRAPFGSRDSRSVTNKAKEVQLSKVSNGILEWSAIITGTQPPCLILCQIKCLHSKSSVSLEPAKRRKPRTTAQNRLFARKPW